MHFLSPVLSLLEIKTSVGLDRAVWKVAVLDTVQCRARFIKGDGGLRGPWVSVGWGACIHVQKSHGLLACTESHYLGPALVRPGPLPMGMCQPGMKGRAV
jgi:hypothetical protein